MTARVSRDLWRSRATRRGDGAGVMEGNKTRGKALGAGGNARAVEVERLGARVAAQEVPFLPADVAPAENIRGRRAGERRARDARPKAVEFRCGGGGAAAGVRGDMARASRSCRRPYPRRASRRPSPASACPRGGAPGVSGWRARRGTPSGPPAAVRSGFAGKKPGAMSGLSDAAAERERDEGGS